MASHKENVADDDDETQTLNGSQFEDKTRTEAQGGETYGGSSGRPWLRDLTDSEIDHDKKMVERWKGEADSALIFAGLFSAVIMVSFVESYKWLLSPDSGDQTVELLTQISGQLELPDHTNASVKSGPSVGPTAAVLVNLAWFSSMALCFSCSVGATLIQQWARRYLVLIQGPERVYLRPFMLNGVRKFQVERTIQLMGISLHSSILLYAVGVLKFILDINTMLGFTALGICLMLGLMYSIVTFLPLFFFDCPYSTPWSAFAWRATHLILFAIFWTIRFIGDLFHKPLSTLWDRKYRQMGGSRRPARWRDMLEQRVNTHRQRFLDGQQRTVELYARNASTAPRAMDVEWASMV